MKIVCIGDSLIYGYGVKPSQCWVSLAAEKMGITMINRGVNGDTTSGMLARFEDDVLAEKPDMVLILGGTNDIMLREGAEGAKMNLRTMAFKAVDNGITPVIAAPAAICETCITPGWKAYAGVEDFSDIIEEADDYCRWLISPEAYIGAAVVDFYTPFAEIVRSENPKPYFADGLHPGKRGHALMAEVFCDWFRCTSSCNR